MSPSLWDALPEEVRTILEEEARGVQDFVYETAARLDDELLGQIRAEGVQINEPSREAFLEASRSMYDDFASTVPGGAALIERATSAGSR